MSFDQATASVRVADAQRRAEERLRHQRDLLKPLGWAVIAVVVASVVTQQPAPGPTAAGIAVAVATGVYAAATAVVISNRFLTRPEAVQGALVVTMAAAGVALSWLQPRGATDLAAGAAAWMAITRLRLGKGVAIAAGVAVAGGASAARTGSPSTVVAVLLLTALLALVAYMLRQGRDSQAQAEVLLAELADARDAQAQAAVVAERGRIAAELHDVLAHALSGAALQLQGARMLAEREGAGSPLTEAIEQAAHLVADGLVNARHAVQALRGAGISSVTQLERLVEDCRRDFRLQITLQVEGTPHPLPPEPALALYRGVEEALTNAARHAPGAATQVRLTYLPDLTTVHVENTLRASQGDAPAGTGAAGLSALGGGHGLAGMRERIERLGGTMHTGPTGQGWHVDLSVPTPTSTP